MASIWHRPRGLRKDVPVDEAHPLNVIIPEDPWADLGLPPVAGRTITRTVRIPGVGAGAAYASLDQFGAIIEFQNVVRQSKRTGLWHCSRYFDLDDEGLQLDLHLFSQSVTLAADNAAAVISDSDLRFYLGTVQFTTFADFNTGQTSFVGNVGATVESTSGTSLWGVAQAKGALNIAAGSEPFVSISILVD